MNGFSWRTLGGLHEDPRLVAWWTAGPGQLAAWLPAARWRFILSLVAVWLCFAKALDEKGSAVPPNLRAAVVAPVLLAIAYGVQRFARRFARASLAIRRRPQIALHLGFWALLALIWVTPAGFPGRAELVLVAVLLRFLLWRLGYVLKSGQRGKTANAAFTDHLFYLWPPWGGSETPYGKGFDYLSRHQAQVPEALARSQLAGIKLLLLALLWQGVMFCMSGIVFGDPDNRLSVLMGGHGLGIPRLDQLVQRRAEVPLLVAWIAIYADLVWSVLRIAAKGHVYIGVLRLLGFNVFANTDRPLLATSILDFWNRYYYYFKELLVEFFFYPVYARLSVRPWLRTLLAVFAAAFAGNVYYHLLDQEAFLIDGDLRALLGQLRSRMVYCFLLACGIYVSMMRERSRRGAGAAVPSPLLRARRIAGVWTFFALIHVWAHPGVQPTLAERSSFVLSLFGL